MRLDSPALLEMLPDVVIVMEADGTIVYANAAVTNLLGWRPDELVGRSGFDFVHPDEQAEAVDRIAEQVESGTESRRHHLEVARSDGGYLKFEMIAAPLPEARDRFLLVLRDVSEREEAQKRLHRSDEQLRALTENVPDALGRFDADGRLVFETRELSAVVAANEGLVERWRRQVCEVVASGQRIDADHLLDSGTRWVGVRFVPERGPEGEITHVLVIASDITATKEREQRLVAEATHDPLTGLPNRRRFTELAERTFSRRTGDRHDEHGGGLALVFVDLDDFKSVNDVHGHNAGDTVLSVVGRRLGEIVRPRDVVARFGGDEFVMLCHDLGAEEADSVAERIASLLAEPIPAAVPEGQLTIGASVGFTMAEPGEHDLDAMIERADQAMYRSKAERATGATPPLR